MFTPGGAYEICETKRKDDRDSTENDKIFTESREIA